MRFALNYSLLLFSFALALVAADRIRANDAKRGSQPNVVVILADDLGLGDLAAYNSESKIPTPNMNRLAAEGLRMTDMHSPSAVCTPTRYALLTGRYCWRSRLKSGVLGGYSPLLIDTGRPTLATLMREAGYATGGVGKWHLGLGSAGKTDYSQPLKPGPLELGFDSFFGIPASLDMQPYVYVVDHGVEQQPTETVAGSGHRRNGGDGFWRGGPVAPGFKHIDVLPRIEQEASAFIAKQAANKEQAFFLYVPLSAPHTPWLPTDEFRGKTKVGYYGDFTVQVDHTVGQILKAIDKAGVAGNTLVIVTSDNGSHWPVDDIEKYDHRANYIYRGQKADIHEGGHRIPFIARWPGRIEAGTQSDQLACLTDCFATLAELTGQELPADAAEDSFSLFGTLTGKGSGPRTSVVNHSLSGMFAIRQGDWKLIEGLGSGGFTAPRKLAPKAGGPKGQLYNLRDDPDESENLYQAMPDKVAELEKLLNTIRSSGRSRE